MENGLQNGLKCVLRYIDFEKFYLLKLIGYDEILK